MTTHRDPIADIEKGWELPLDQVPVEFADHAVERYNLRIGRHLDLLVSATEMNRRLAEAGAVVTRKEPDFRWVRKQQSKYRNFHSWLICTDPELVCPLADRANRGKLIAVTTLYDGEGAPVGASVRGMEKLDDLF